MRWTEATGCFGPEVAIPPVRRTLIVELGWKIYRWLYRLSAGRLGSILLGWPVILLTTIGRKSGRPRTVALHDLLRESTYVVAASSAGEERQPQWLLNLLADRFAQVQHGRRRVPVRARVAEGEERAELWGQITPRDPSYLEYQNRTEREIPVVVLEPTTVLQPS